MDVHHMQRAAGLMPVWAGMARPERFELPTLGIEIRCSIQLSYERVSGPITRLGRIGPAGRQSGGFGHRAGTPGQGTNFASIGGRNGLLIQ